MEEKNDISTPKETTPAYMTCKNAVFNELWGEYKCKARMTSITNNSNICCSIYCKDYKKK